jgi:hypothetical protein
MSVMYLALTGVAMGGPPVDPGAAPATMQSRLDLAQPDFSAPQPPDPNDLPPIPDVWLKSHWNPQPWLEARVEAVWLQPLFDDAPVLARQFQADSAFVFSLVDIRPRADEYYVVAPRVAVELHANELWSVEMTSFFLDGPNEDDVRFGDPDVPFRLLTAAGGPISNAPPGFPAVADVFTLDWDFESFNADATLLRHWIFLHGPISDLALGIGARYFRIDEKARLFAADQLLGSSGRMDVDVENRLAGPQFVARGRVQGPGKRLRSVAEVKIGLMTNASDNSTTLLVSGATVAGGAGSQTRFAPLFEANFLVECFVAEHVTVFGGFQMFYLDRVDRAAEQFNADLAAFATGTARDIGSLFMYGPRVGLVISY